MCGFHRAYCCAPPICILTQGMVSANIEILLGSHSLIQYVANPSYEEEAEGEMPSLVVHADNVQIETGRRTALPGDHYYYCQK